MRHFFDGGAHVGQVFNWLPQDPRYAEHHIWCFEPSPRHLTALRNRCVNAAMLNRRMITLCPFALSNRTGWSPLHEKQDHFGDSIFRDLYFHTDLVKDDPFAPRILCPTVDVATFILTEIPPGDVITMKLDVEGSEFIILERLLNFPGICQRVERILVEWHGLDSPTAQDERRQVILDRIMARGIPLEPWTI